jgi:putative membrane protein
MADTLKHSEHELAESAKQMEHSTKRVERSTERVEDSADRRTVLAADRTVFAAERTYAAWVRTGLLALASGLGARALLTDVPSWIGIGAGTVMVLFAAFCFVAGVWRHLNPGAPPPAPDAPQLPPALLIAINGVLLLVAIAALVALWFGRVT